MIIIILLIILACLVFAYVPLTLVFIHSRTGKLVADKYHDLKKRYWKTDYYGDSELDLEDLEKALDKELKR